MHRPCIARVILKVPKTATQKQGEASYLPVASGAAILGRGADIVFDGRNPLAPAYDGIGMQQKSSARNDVRRNLRCHRARAAAR
jgi:hypothetical protein